MCRNQHEKRFREGSPGPTGAASVLCQLRAGLLALVFSVYRVKKTASIQNLDMWLEQCRASNEHRLCGFHSYTPLCLPGDEVLVCFSLLSWSRRATCSSFSPRRISPCSRGMNRRDWNFNAYRSSECVLRELYWTPPHVSVNSPHLHGGIRAL